MKVVLDPLLQIRLSTLCCRSGKFIHELASLPLAEDIPIAFNSCRKGPRSLGWRSDKPAEMVWTEAQVQLLSQSHVRCRSLFEGCHTLHLPQAKVSVGYSMLLAA